MTESSGLETEITEENIARFVYDFYAQVRRHPVLGPVFNERLDGRWRLHQENMIDFWSNVLLRTGRYFGNPLIKHRNVSTIRREHFADWLVLFRQTLDTIYVPETAEQVHLASRRMAGGLTHGIFGPELVQPEQ